MNRAQSRIRPERGKEQRGFVQDAGTRNAIFMIRMSSERAIEERRTYICVLLTTQKHLIKSNMKNC